MTDDLDLETRLRRFPGGGWRSAAWQAAHHAARGSGVAEHSQHSEGRAADVACSGMTGVQLHEVVLLLWNEGRLLMAG